MITVYTLPDFCESKIKSGMCEQQASAWPAVTCLVNDVFLVA